MTQAEYQLEYRPFLKTLPKDQRVERYRYMLIEWDIAKIRYCLYLHPREIEQADVAVMMKGMNCQVNVKYAMGKDIDLSAPLFAVHLALPGSVVDDSLLLIDGHHRVYRASFEAIPSLPCYVLTRQEEVRCRTRQSIIPHPWPYSMY